MHPMTGQPPIEELRVSLLAQQLGTARPVAEQHIYRGIDSVAL
jgi:ATP-dependent helicase HrpA